MINFIEDYQEELSEFISQSSGNKKLFVTLATFWQNSIANRTRDDELKLANLQEEFQNFWFAKERSFTPVRTFAYRAKNCKKGISCGDSCIAASKTCRKTLTPPEKKKKTPSLKAATKKKATSVAVTPTVDRSDFKSLIAHGEKIFSQFSVDSSLSEKMQEELAALRKEREEIEIKKNKSSGKTWQKLDDRLEETMAKMAALNTKIREEENKGFEDLLTSLSKPKNITETEIEDAVNRLNFLDTTGTGIPPQVKSALASFYRLTNTKEIPTLENFVYMDENRSNADFFNKNINISNRNTVFLKSTIYHEMAHHYEYSDPQIGLAARNWIGFRATGQPEKLSDLTGAADFSDDEIALPDHFSSPYVGKIYDAYPAYKNRVSEVISMGFEGFTNAQTMKSFYNKDKEHFFLMVGVLA